MLFFQDCFYQFEALPEEYISTFTTWINDYKYRLTINISRHEERKKKMDAVNPKYVLRNYLAQQAIEEAEQGDYSLIEQLHQVLLSPYTEQKEMESFAQKRPDWAKNKAGCSMLSCSS